MNVSLFTVRHVFVEFVKGMESEIRNPECGIRNPFRFLICGKSFCIYNISVGCLWHSHGKNPVRLYPKLQSQPIGLPKIFIDYLFFQADQSDCTKSVSIFNQFASSEER